MPTERRQRRACATARHDERAREGFTLFEVMAAVAILAIWYIVLAGAGIQGLRAEGVNRRVLEASLVADSALADLEAIAIEGTAPEIQDETLEDPSGRFTIHVVVTPFAMGGGPGGAADDVDAEEPVASANGEQPPAPSLRALIAKEMPGMTNYLRSIDVTVSWQEGAHERTVVRRSFVFDRLAAIEAIQEMLGPAGAPFAGDATGGQPSEAPER